MKKFYLCRACEIGTAKANGYPDAAYDMSKIALNTLTRIQQKQFDSDPSRTNIIVCAVCPGYCKTDATRGGGILSADVGEIYKNRLNTYINLTSICN